MLGERCRKNVCRDQGNAFSGGRNVWQKTNGHITLSRKREKKVGLVSKPHILLSQMVLLSKHLVADSYWTEFVEDPCFKKKWLIWGKTNVSCSFSGSMICGSCGLLHMEIFLFNLLSYFQQMTLVPFLIGPFWEEARVSFKQYT